MKGFDDHSRMIANFHDINLDHFIFREKRSEIISRFFANDHEILSNTKYKPLGKLSYKLTFFQEEGAVCETTDHCEKGTLCAAPHDFSYVADRTKGICTGKKS